MDGALLDGYACTSDLQNATGTQMCGIGTFCHEFGHTLGWIDLYDTDYETNGRTFGMMHMSLMASGNYNNGGRTPPALTLLERWQAGWIDALEMIGESGNYTLPPVWEDRGYAIATENEFFILENRGLKESV